MTQRPTAGQPPRQSARFSIANNAKNAKQPITAQAAFRCPKSAAGLSARPFLTERIVWRRQGILL